jgi:phage/plasmid-like protein (TIGR03299 family)
MMTVNTIAPAVDVNAQFASEKLRQMKSAEERKNWLDAEVAAGNARRNKNGSVTMLKGWDRGETFSASGMGLTGLDEKENGETALYLKDTPAWHSLGQVIPGGLKTAAEVLNAAGLLYTVAKVQDEFEGQPIPGKHVIYREDTRQPLGVVGDIYTPFQNLQSYEMLDELLEFGMIAETAGSFRGGSRTFISARIPEDLVLDPGGLNDPIRQYLMIRNSHDGSTPVTAVVTPWRPVCQNTERFAIRDAKTKWTVRHTKNMAGKIQEAKRALGLTQEYYKEWAREETELIQTPFKANLIDKLIDEVWGELDKDPSKRAKTMRDTQRSTLQELWRREVQRSGETAYTMERAATEYVDHFVQLRPRNDLKGKPLEALGQAILEESQDEVKNKVHEKLMNLARIR